MEVYTHIVKRPDNKNYHLVFRQIYGFEEGDCETAIRSFTDEGFTVVYKAKTKVDTPISAKELAHRVNVIIGQSNEDGSLDTRSLDELLKH